MSKISLKGWILISAVFHLVVALVVLNFPSFKIKNTRVTPIEVDLQGDFGALGEESKTKKSGKNSVSREEGHSEHTKAKRLLENKIANKLHNTEKANAAKNSATTPKPQSRPAPEVIEEPESKESKAPEVSDPEIKEAPKEEAPAPQETPTAVSSESADIVQSPAPIKQAESPKPEVKTNPKPAAAPVPSPKPRTKQYAVQEPKKEVVGNKAQSAEAAPNSNVKNAEEIRKIVGAVKSSNNDFATSATTQVEQDEATVALARYVQAQLIRCWHLPVAFSAAYDSSHSYIINVTLSLDIDGRIIDNIVKDEDLTGDPAMVAALRSSVVKAIQACTPISGLPVEKYNVWRYMDLTFDPRKASAHR